MGLQLCLSELQSEANLDVLGAIDGTLAWIAAITDTLMPALERSLTRLRAVEQVVGSAWKNIGQSKESRHKYRSKQLTYDTSDHSRGHIRACHRTESNSRQHYPPNHRHPSPRSLFRGFDTPAAYPCP